MGPRQHAVVARPSKWPFKVLAGLIDCWVQAGTGPQAALGRAGSPESWPCKQEARRLLAARKEGGVWWSPEKAIKNKPRYIQHARVRTPVAEPIP